MENQNLGTRRPSENRLSHRRIREDGLSLSILFRCILLLIGHCYIGKWIIICSGNQFGQIGQTIFELLIGRSLVRRLMRWDRLKYRRDARKVLRRLRYWSLHEVSRD